MENEKQTENNSTFEQSPQEILAMVSDKANEVIDNAISLSGKNYSLKSDVSPEGAETKSLTSYQNGATLERTLDDQTGSAAYSLTVLYHTGKDRGSWDYSWSDDGASVNAAVNSEMNGISEKPEMTATDEIKIVQSLLERYFPAQESEQIPVSRKKTLGGKVLAFFNK